MLGFGKRRTQEKGEPTMLGCKCKDLITGIEGVVVGRTEWLYGCNRITMQPFGLDSGKPHSQITIDDHRAEIDESDRVVEVHPQNHPNTIKLGSRVRDKLTGFTGIAVARSVWSSGECDITVDAEGMHEGKPVDAQSFVQQRVELVEEKKPPIAKASTSITGGPQNDPKPKCN